ncbi:hypothetical protein TNCV_1215951 [Trichonephila clavipes]|nr:hypothetical protein TNCV_1215951 [Trichonephila clavipes]
MNAFRPCDLLIIRQKNICLLFYSLNSLPGWLLWLRDNVPASLKLQRLNGWSIAASNKNSRKNESQSSLFDLFFLQESSSSLRDTSAGWSTGDTSNTRSRQSEAWERRHPLLRNSPLSAGEREQIEPN